MENHEGKVCYNTIDGEVWMSDEEYLKASDAFFEKYPDFPDLGVIEVLECGVDREYFEDVKSGKRRAAVITEDSPIMDDVLVDKDVLAYCETKKRDKFFQKWQPIFADAISEVILIRFTCEGEEFEVGVKNQDWAIEMDEMDTILKEEYGCPDIADFVDENLTAEGMQKKMEAGVPLEDIGNEEPEGYLYFIFDERPADEVFAEYEELKALHNGEWDPEDYLDDEAEE